MSDDTVTIPIRKLKASGRARKKFSKIQEMMDSISKYGLLHPVVVTEEDDEGKYTLLAGERRLRACTLLGWVNIPCTFKKDLSRQEQKEIELEENIQRDDLEWTEKIENYRQIDEIKRAKEGSAQHHAEGGWGIDKMAELTGQSRSGIAKQISFAKQLKDRPDLKEQVKDLPLNVAIRTVDQKLETERIGRLADKGLITMSSDLRNGSCIDLIKDLEDDSVDLLLTDPPFGIAGLKEDPKNAQEVMSYKATLKESDNADRETVIMLFGQLAPELRRVLKPKSHVYIFFAYELHAEIHTIMEAAGFVMDWVPIIWDKGRTTAPFMGYKYSPSYEPIMFGHLLPREKRLVTSCRDIILHKPLQAKDKIHPFEKPQSLLQYLIKQSTNEGDVVLDPFAGSGSTLVAGKSIGRSVVGFELDKENFQRAQKRLMDIGDKDA